MKVMILAAGRGERMMPLTANLPKPMLRVAGKPLLQHHIENLAKAGLKDIVINIAWCGQAIIDYFADGKKFGVNICYSDERSGALETAGGIVKALPLLTEPNSSDDDCFLVVNGDVFCDVDFNQLPKLSEQQTACLWLTDNPAHNLAGDFVLTNEQVNNKTSLADVNLPNNETTYTFSGIALYKKRFFNNISTEKLALGPLLKQAAEQGQLKGLKLTVPWTDVGTPARLASLNEQLTDLNK